MQPRRSANLTSVVELQVIAALMGLSTLTMVAHIRVSGDEPTFTGLPTAIGVAVVALSL